MRHLLVAVLAVTCTAGCVSPGDQRRERAKMIWTSHKDAAVPDSWEAQLNNYWDNALKDPSSRTVKFTGASSSIVCGDINARNSYGGYTGFTRFAAMYSAAGRLEHVKIFSDLRHGYYYGGFDDNESGTGAVNSLLAEVCGVPLFY